ncbi:DUF1727 domain-containing protein, partial [Candidatus Parcubacteria bacterium]|nr:DUF1727 domain-containing protein [Candidatus Parcubacteria bacterium]
MRTKLAIFSGKILQSFIKFLGLGTGATWPGHLALKIQPELLRYLENRLSQGSILISGTNGKTTTAHLISSILRESGLTVVHNPSGANLVNGLVSALITDCSWIGGRRSDLAVFEVDERNLPLALGSFNPEIVVLLNLSRDQLDRYAELELTLEKWHDALVGLPQGVAVIYDETDSRLRQLAEAEELEHLQWQSFGLKRPAGFASPLPGGFNQKNTNAAVQVA